MKALLLVDEEQDTIRLSDIPILKFENNEVLIKIKFAALNHRDQWCREGKYPNIKYNVVLGSDGLGVVEKIGKNVDDKWLGKEVIINSNINWGNNQEAQSTDYQILGMPTNGTFAEYIAVPADRIMEKPVHLSGNEAAALPLGGLTAYRAVFNKGQVTKGMKVFVSGIGGGVAQFVFQFCKSIGAKVYTNSGSQSKIEKAMNLGAKACYNYKDDNWVKNAIAESKKFDVIIDSAGGSNVNYYLKMIKRGGKIVHYGSTMGRPKNFNIATLFFSQASIHGSTMGNDEEFKLMIDFVKKYKIKPILDSVRPFDDIISAFDKMKAGRQFGKLVVNIS